MSLFFSSPILVLLQLLASTTTVSAMLTSYSNITEVFPSGITNLDSNQTLFISGARDGDQVFLAVLQPYGSMTGGYHATNCSNPPTLASGHRSPTMTIANEEVSLDPSQLSAGNYTVCYRGSYNDTNSTFALVARFTALTITTVTVGGPVNSDLSHFTCCNNFTAGEYGNCTVYLKDDLGFPTGSLNASLCNLAICPLRDGKGHYIHNRTEITSEQPGVFMFSFVPEGSGCSGTAGVKFNNAPLANKQVFFSVRAGSPVSNASTSACSVLVNGTTVCTITQRDAYDNGIRLCTYDSDGGDPVCSEIN